MHQVHQSNQRMVKLTGLIFRNDFRFRDGKLLKTLKSENWKLLKCQKGESQIKLQFMRKVGQGWSLIVFMLETDVVTCSIIFGRRAFT